MVKAKKEEEIKDVSDSSLISAFLNENKEDHYNFVEEKFYKISTGSLLLDNALDGGFTPGLHRFVGVNSGGKTSEAIEVIKNFFSELKDAKGVYFCAEGRLNKDARKRSGLTFVSDPKDWKNHTVFVYESNIYESVASFMELLVKQETTTCYIMVLDSVDGLTLKNDMAKGFEDSAKVAGGANVASVLMKKISIPLAKKGHMGIFISQVRADVVLDPYAPKTVRQISGTGGNALLHYANFILDFQPRYKSDLMVDDEKQAPSMSNPIKGHWAKVIIKKSPNEKQNYVIKYPIKYGDAGKTGSIWLEKEIIDLLMQFEDLEKKGAWFNFSETLIASSNGIITSDKFQGLEKVFDYLSSDKKIVSFLYEYLRNMIVSTYQGSEEKNEVS